MLRFSIAYILLCLAFMGLNSSASGDNASMAETFSTKDCKGADNRNLWLPRSVQNQKNLGACHAFAVTDFVAAEIFRLYGVRVTLSARDLFQNLFFLKSIYGDNANKDPIDLQLAEATRLGIAVGSFRTQLDAKKNEDESFGEGKNVLDVFRYLKMHGVCYEKSLPFNIRDFDFMGKLLSLRKLRQDYRETISSSVSKMSPFQRRLYQDQFLRESSELVKDSVFANFLREMKASWEKAPTPQMATERAQVKEWARGIFLKEIPPPFDDYGKIMATDSALPDTKQRLVELAVAGKPILLNIGNYQAMASKNGDYENRRGGHGVIIAGYDCRSDEFIIRNSWDGIFSTIYDYEDGFERISANDTTRFFYSAHYNAK